MCDRTNARGWGVWLLVLLSSALLAGCSGEKAELSPSDGSNAVETTVALQLLDPGTDHTKVVLRFDAEGGAGPPYRFRWRLAELNRIASVDWSETVEREVVVDLSAVIAPASLSGEGDLLCEAIAVDAQNQEDSTPVRRAFTPRTVSPEVTIVAPGYRPVQTCETAGPALHFVWEGHDADTKGGAPAQARHVLLELGAAADPCPSRTGFQDDNPVARLAPDDPRWSEWVDYDAEDSAHPSRQFQLEDLQVGHIYAFAVQVRDIDGATSRDFEWGKDVRVFRVAGQRWPTLILFEPILGDLAFVGADGVVSFDTLDVQPIEFSWEAHAETYLSEIASYRWGVDLLDPQDPDDPGWRVDAGLGLQTRTTGTLLFSAGEHVLTIVARDLAGTETRVRIRLQVEARANATRDLLLVYDAPPAGLGGGRAEGIDRWVERLRAADSGWDPNGNVIDAASSPAELTLQRLMEYASVVWVSRFSSNSFLQRALAPSGVRHRRYNWLETYQRFGGTLLLAGEGAAFNLLPPEVEHLTYPVVLATEEGGSLGFGSWRLPDGSTVAFGTLLAPYRAFCLELMDQVRPSFTRIFGESPGSPLRSVHCDRVVLGQIDEDFALVHPAAQGLELVGSIARQQGDGFRTSAMESFYDFDATARGVEVQERGCVEVMFRMQASAALDPEGCAGGSVLDGAAIAIRSTAYSDSKREAGGADYLWGFDLTEFDLDSAAAALRFVLEDWRVR